MIREAESEESKRRASDSSESDVRRSGDGGSDDEDDWSELELGIAVKGAHVSLRSSDAGQSTGRASQGTYTPSTTSAQRAARPDSSSSRRPRSASPSSPRSYDWRIEAKAS